MNDPLIKSEKISLQPAKLSDKKTIFNWLTNSNLTSEMIGPPNFPDNPIPTWEEFNNDYVDYHFDGTAPLKGRCFIIIHNCERIGQINYNEIDPVSKSTELDIWLADKKYTGHGFGTEAIKLMCTYLYKSFRCQKIYMQPSRRNVNAIKAYKKAGFIEQAIFPDGFVLDYWDSVLLEWNASHL